MHGRNRKRGVQKDCKETAPPAPRKIPFGTLVLLFALITVASFLPDRRLWGLNHLAFYPLPVRIITLLLMAVSFLPSVAKGCHSLISRSFDYIRSRRRLLNIVIVVIAVVFVAVSVRYRSSTLLLGDGQLVVRNYEYVSEGYTNVVTRDIRTILSDEDIAKGASLLYFLSVQVSEHIFSSTPINGIRIFNCFLGGIFIVLLLLVAFHAEITTELRIWMIFLVLSSGTMELFFGYVENYTPLILFCFLYLTSAFALIHKRRLYLVFINLLLLLMSVFIHIQAALLVPSFVLLVVWYAAGRHGDSVLRYVTPSLAALSLIGFIVAKTFTGYGEHILNVRSSETFYGITAPSHWIDIFNELMILSPMLPFLAIMAITIFLAARKSQAAGRNGAAIKSRAPRPGRKSTDGGWFVPKVEWHLAYLILVPTLIYLVIFKTEIGVPRDWDLFTISFIGLLPLAILIIHRFLGQARVRSIPRLTIPALVMSTLLGIAWIGINASAARSVERFERILRYEKTNEAYVYEILAKHYYRENQLDRAIPAVEKALSLSHNPRHYVMLGKYNMKAERTEAAIEVLEAFLRNKPESEYAEWARSTLVTLLDRTGQYSKLLSVARDGIRHHPDKPIYHYFFGKMLLAQGKFREGVDALLECKRLNPPPAVLQDVDDVIASLKSQGKI
jgi:hypothetical protein